MVHNYTADNEKTAPHTWIEALIGPRCNINYSNKQQM